MSAVPTPRAPNTGGVGPVECDPASGSGIVINDSIVLVTTIDERMQHEARATAVVNGSCDRLRAVILGFGGAR